MVERRFDVFLSYNSADRTIVERVARRLREERIEAWWDAWALTPGDAWQDEIVEGLRSSKACAVMVGAAGLGSWARQELALALDLAARKELRAFLVKLPGFTETPDAAFDLLRMTTWVDLRNGIDADGIQDLVCAITGSPRHREVVAAEAGTCPYRGLEAFEEEHADLFFGREADVAVAVEKLHTSRFLALLGPSGSGKSSLLRAGLVPALRRGALAGSGSWTVRVFTPGPRPLTSMAAQMAHLFGQPMGEALDGLRDTRSLDLAAAFALDGHPPGDRVVLVVDQLEEVFTLCGDEDERRRFLSNLVYAAAAVRGRVVVIVGMRADFYPRCASYPDVRMLVSAHQLLVGPLDQAGLHDAVEEPAHRVGLTLEAGLVERIAADVGDRPGTLPLLEHVLLATWERRRGTMLTLEAYMASGGLEEALGRTAEEAYASLSPEQQDVARRILLRLIQPGEGAEDTRRLADLSELVSRPEEDGEVVSVVSALADKRLVTTAQDKASGARVVTLTHEALIRGWPRLQAWISDARETIRAQRHLTHAATDWHRQGRHDDDLYSGTRLAAWKEKELRELSETERAFVARSVERDARRATADRRRAFLAAGGVVLASAIVALVAVVGRSSAEGQARIARSRELAAEADLALLTDPARALALALEAYGKAPTEQAGRALTLAARTPGSRVVPLRGHDGAVNSAAFSRDGRQIVSTGDDGTVRVWESAGEGAGIAAWEPTGDLRGKVLPGHERGASAAFSPNGTLVVSAGADGTVRISDWREGTGPSVLKGHVGAVRAADFSLDGRRVVSVGDDGTVRVWDWASQAELAKTGPYPGTVDPVRLAIDVMAGRPSSIDGPAALFSAAFSSDGTQVVSGGADNIVRVWDWARSHVTELKGHDGRVTSVRFSPDDRQVVSGSQDDSVRIWDLTRELDRMSEHSSDVTSVAISPDGRRVASAAADQTVRLWDLDTASRRVLGPPSRLRPNSVSFSTDGARLVTAGDDGLVRVWGSASGPGPAVRKAHDEAVNVVAFSPDGQRLLSAGDETDVFDLPGKAPIKLWDPLFEQDPVMLEKHTGSVTDAVFSPDGSQVVSAGDDTTVRVWDTAAGRERTEPGGEEGSILAVGNGPDGPQAVTKDERGRVLVRWTPREEPAPLEARTRDVTGAAFSPDGRTVLTVEYRGIRIWSSSATGPIELSGSSDTIDAAFSSDGQKVVGGDRNGGVRVWSANGKGRPIVLRGSRVKVNEVAFSPDGKRVLSADEDGIVQVWDWAREGKPTVLAAPAQEGRAMRTAVFSPDGRWVAAGDATGALLMWDCSACGSLDRIAEDVRRLPKTD